MLRAYSSTLLPHLLLLDHHELLEEVASLCQRPLQELFKQCLPLCMVFITSSYAQQHEGDTNESSQERQAAASRSHDLLIELIGKEVYMYILTMYMYI